APLVLLGLAREAFEQPLDFAVLFALAVGPFPDHLLLGAHMRDQALDGVGKIGYCRYRAAVAAAFLDGCAQPLDCALQVAAGALAAAVFANGGGEPVFEIGVEAVLRLARLQIEKAEDQRTGESAQRG